jgi:SAM-dependent methyltransferase
MQERGPTLLLIYTLTMFVSATLLFLVQPMFARMILPMLGGSPAVWNTAVLFYQTVLLGGYVSAHAITTRLRIRQQVALYGVLLLVPLLILPISVPAGWNPPTETSPIPWLLTVLLVAVGLPFFVLSTSSPVIQRWFSYTDHPSAHDPYFLYAASNVGSILGLLIYPFVLERTLRLQEQSWLWAGGYVLYVILMLASGWVVWRSRNMVSQKQQEEEAATRRMKDSAEHSSHGAAGLTWRRRLRWVLWAIVPSSLMLSVTTYLSTNIAAIPLFWVVPLALYLLTYVLVFARKPPIPHWLVVRALPIVLLPLLIVLITDATDPIWLLFPLHLLVFFIITMACHGALAADRPAAKDLTAFYMWLSIGGALGGLFNALLAPLLFDGVLEYPLMLVLVAFFSLFPAKERSSPAGPANEESERAEAQQGGSPAVWLREWWAVQRHRRDIWLPLALALLTAGLIVGVQTSNIGTRPVQLALMFGLPLLLCFSFSRRPLRFGLGVALLMLVSYNFYAGVRGEVVHQERSFFGVHTVRHDQEKDMHLLVHGTTLHGVQSLDPERACESLSYYHRTGPIGQVFASLNKQDSIEHVAVVGLGVGSLAAYSQPGQQWVYYEIDPFVRQIARNPRYFTYLGECAADVQVVLGDARLSLQEAPDNQYDVMVLDAYSSDAIPIHLMTREALQLYLRKLAPDGVLAFHVSNRYLNLKPVLAELAADAEVIALNRDDMQISEKLSAQGKNSSQWVVLANNREALGPLATDNRWKRLEREEDMPLWTDDFASILSVLEF